MYLSVSPACWLPYTQGYWQYIPVCQSPHHTYSFHGQNPTILTHFTVRIAPSSLISMSESYHPQLQLFYCQNPIILTHFTVRPLLFSQISLSDSYFSHSFHCQNQHPQSFYCQTPTFLTHFTVRIPTILTLFTGNPHPCHSYDITVRFTALILLRLPTIFTHFTVKILSKLFYLHSFHFPYYCQNIKSISDSLGLPVLGIMGIKNRNTLYCMT